MNKLQLRKKKKTEHFKTMSIQRLRLQHWIYIELWPTASQLNQIVSALTSPSPSGAGTIRTGSPTADCSEHIHLSLSLTKRFSKTFSWPSHYDMIKVRFQRKNTLTRLLAVQLWQNAPLYTVRALSPHPISKEMDINGPIRALNVGVNYLMSVLGGEPNAWVHLQHLK